MKGIFTRFLDSSVAVLIRRRWWAGMFLLAAMGVSAYYFFQVPFNNSILAISLAEDPLIKDYNHFSQIFHGDEEVYVLAHSEQDWGEDFLAKLDHLTLDLRHIGGVRAVISASDFLSRLRREQSSTLAASVDLLRRDPLAERFVIASDGRTLALVLLLDNFGHDDGRRNQVLSRIETVVAGYRTQDQALLLGGIPMIHKVATNLTQRDINVFGPLTLVVTLCLVFLIYRSWLMVLGLAWTVVASSLITLGILGARGESLNWVTILLPTILLIMSVCNVIQLVHHFFNAAQLSSNKIEVIKSAVRKSLFPCALISLTTLLAFLTLTTSDIVIMRQFGHYAALGVGLALVLTFVLFILCASLIPRHKITRGSHQGIFGTIQGLTLKWATVAVRHPKPIFTLGIVVMLACFFGTQFVRSDTDINGYFAPSSDVHQAMQLIDRTLAGSSTMEIVFENRAGSVLEPHFLHKVENTLATLLASPDFIPVGHVSWLVPYLKKTAFELSGEAVLPQDPRRLAEIFGVLEGSMPDYPLGDLISADRHFLRVVLREPVIGSSKAWPAIAWGMDYLARTFSGDVRATLTGSGPIFTHMTHYLVSYQVKSFTLAYALVLILMVCYMGSMRLGLISMVPQVVPVVVVFGLLGFLKMPLTVGQAMFATACIGVIVDDTIHLLWAYRRFLQSGENTEEAILHAFQSSGIGVVIASMILILGLGMMLFSDFIPTAQWGFLVSTTIAIALLGDLFLLPASLALFMRPTPEEEIFAAPTSQGLRTQGSPTQAVLST